MDISSSAPALSVIVPQVEEDPARYCAGGYHPVMIGDVYANRYQVMLKLGFGAYSTVWLAHDSWSVLLVSKLHGADFSKSKNQHVALKIVVAHSHGGENAFCELEILQRILTADPSHDGYKHVIHLLDNFQHTGPNGKHLCLVFKVMGESVSALRRRFPTRQIPAALMKQIARQVLLGLDYLHQSCGVIHTGVLFLYFQSHRVCLLTLTCVRYQAWQYFN